jgi:hypothetical protein
MAVTLGRDKEQCFTLCYLYIMFLEQVQTGVFNS